MRQDQKSPNVKDPHLSSGVSSPKDKDMLVAGEKTLTNKETDQSPELNLKKLKLNSGVTEQIEEALQKKLRPQTAKSYKKRPLSAINGTETQ